jgi:hypothetical protein
MMRFGLLIPLLMSIAPSTAAAQYVAPVAVTPIVSRSVMREPIALLRRSVTGQSASEDSVGTSRSTHAWWGALVGATIGVASVLLHDRATVDTCDFDQQRGNCGFGVQYELVAGAAGGALLGGVIGALLPAHE